MNTSSVGTFGMCVRPNDVCDRAECQRDLAFSPTVRSVPGPRKRTASNPLSSSLRERSSSRARAHISIEVEASEPEMGPNPAELVDEHERKLRRRKLRLLATVEDSFEQVRLLDEGKCCAFERGRRGRFSATVSRRPPPPPSSSRLALLCAALVWARTD